MGVSLSQLSIHAELWSGLVDDYYGARWRQFVKYLGETTPSTYNHTAFLESMFEWEEAWSDDATTDFPSIPVGDTLAISRSLRASYSSIDWSLIRHTAARRSTSSPSAPAERKRRFGSSP